MNDSYRLYEKNRNVVETGVFLALFWAIGYAFLYIPNIEFVTFVAFLSGLILGWKRGAFVALTGEFVFSVANPLGSGLSYPPLLLAQLLGFLFISTAGYLCRNPVRLIHNEQRILIAFFGAAGFFLSFIYDSLTTLAFPLASGFSLAQVWAVYIAGIPFYLIHIASNTLIFSVLGPVIIHTVYKKYPHYLE